MRNTLINHVKIYGKSLGHISWNAGIQVSDNVPVEFIEKMKENYQSDFTKGEIVDIVWPNGSIQGLEIFSINGVFMDLIWKGDWKSYHSIGAPFKYSYGKIQVYKSFVNKTISKELDQ